MKKVTANIFVDGESKTVNVVLDDRTYTLLKRYGDKELFLQYVTEEYLTYLRNRAETRRHKSLDYLLDKGLEFEDERQDLFEMVERSEEVTILKAAMETLTEKQRIIVMRHVLDKQSFREIGDALGIHKESVRIEYLGAIKKLQKFFQKHSVKT